MWYVLAVFDKNHISGTLMQYKPTQRQPLHTSGLTEACLSNDQAGCMSAWRPQLKISCPCNPFPAYGDNNRFHSWRLGRTRNLAAFSILDIATMLPPKLAIICTCHCERLCVPSLPFFPLLSMEAFESPADNYGDSLCISCHVALAVLVVCSLTTKIVSVPACCVVAAYTTATGDRLWLCYNLKLNSSTPSR